MKIYIIFYLIAMFLIGSIQMSLWNLNLQVDLWNRNNKNIVRKHNSNKFNSVNNYSLSIIEK